MTQEELRKIGEIQLEMMDEVHRLCTENNICYCIAYGTLLGAVRHKGFIPWDLDIDVVMPRADYERFRQVCQAQLEAPYGYLDHESQPDYMRPHAIITHSQTRLVYHFDPVNPKQMTKGVYIDIFPLDNAPDDEMEREKHAKQLHRIRRLKEKRMMYCYSFKRWRRFLHYAFAAMLLWIPIAKINRYQQKVMQKYNEMETKNVCSMAGGYDYEKECMPSDMFAKRELMEFEGRLFYGPENYEEYLTKIYGDYMQLPPEEKRQANLKYYISFSQL